LTVLRIHFNSKDNKTAKISYAISNKTLAFLENAQT